jgi:predicted TPR repeat methyltransferase
VNRRARREIRAGHFAAGVGDASRALEAAPDFAEALVCRGEANLRAGSFDAARSDFDAALRLDPGPPGFGSEIRRLRDAAAEGRIPRDPLAYPFSLEDIQRGAR